MHFDRATVAVSLIWWRSDRNAYFTIHIRCGNRSSSTIQHTIPHIKWLEFIRLKIISNAIRNVINMFHLVSNKKKKTPHLQNVPEFVSGRRNSIWLILMYDCWVLAVWLWLRVMANYTSPKCVHCNILAHSFYGVIIKITSCNFKFMLDLKNHYH